jgi:endo-1,4-beta-xylanase
MTLEKRATAALFGLCLSSSALALGDDAPPLKTLLPRGMLIGAALSQKQVDGDDAAGAGIVARHFDSISPENLLKWEKVHPEPDRYDFGPADRYVGLGSKHGMTVIGHTLVWHRQTPAWVFAGKDGGAPDRDELLRRMREHIHAVVGRYRGRIHGWDVVNEALDDDGTLRKTPWLDAIGEDYVAKAFEYAQEADPRAELYYNDFNLAKPAKLAAALRLVRHLRERGLRVDAVGEQGHWLLEGPTSAEIEATIVGIAEAGLKVMITELDVDVLPRERGMEGSGLEEQARFRAATNVFPDGLPAEQQRRLARRYAEVFALFVKHREKIVRVTFWGVHDAQSWLNNFPVRGRVNHPLLWDRNGQPKPALEAVVEVLRRSASEAAR